MKIKKDEFITSNHIQIMLHILNWTMIEESDTEELMFVFLEKDNSIDDIIKGKLTFQLKVVDHGTEREADV